MDSRERFEFRFGFGLDSDSDSSRNLLQPAATCYSLRQPAAICCNLLQSAAICGNLRNTCFLHPFTCSLVPCPLSIGISFSLVSSTLLFPPPCSHTFHELRRIVSELCKNISPAHTSRKSIPPSVQLPPAAAKYKHRLFPRALFSSSLCLLVIHSSPSRSLALSSTRIFPPLAPSTLLFPPPLLAHLL